jgi:hypothetical protein
MEEKMLKQGEQVPGHVVVLIGVEASGEVPIQAQDLDRPFLGFLCPTPPKWRHEILSAHEFKRRYPGLEAR